MIAACFIALTIAVAFAIIFSIRQLTISNGLSSSIVTKATLFLAAWLVFTAGLSLAGIFRVAGIPPRVPVLLVLPTFVFTGFFFFSGRFRHIINNIPAWWPVYFQVFRVAVELLLFGLGQQGRIPRAATFEGYNFDVLIGLTAPVTGWLVTRNKIGLLALRLWNVAGLGTLAVVVFIFISHAYAPQMWHTDMNILISGFGDFPYTWLAGFLMPVAVFMHVCSLATMKKGS